MRRIVPGETGATGGPAFTDVLGVCTAWGPQTCTIAPESGDPVVIPLALIVSGKPVPPRPSPRLRVSARDAELRTAGLAGVETTALGEWQLRYEPEPVGRVRHRFNSCLGIGDPGLPLPEAAARVREFYAARDRPARIQVERGSGTEAGLGALGWTTVPGRDSHLLLASLARVARTLASSARPSGEPGIDRQEAGAHATVTVRPVDDPVGDPAIDPVARGEAGLDGDWLGVHGLEVAPAHRRRGLAHAVLAELLDWGAEQGATTVWLHVQTDNAAALALYDGLGFARHHTCRYLEAPA